MSINEDETSERQENQATSKLRGQKVLNGPIESKSGVSSPKANKRLKN